MTSMTRQSDLVRLAWLQLRGAGAKTVLSAFIHGLGNEDAAPADETLRSCAPDRSLDEVRSAIDAARRLLELSERAGIQVIPYSHPLYPPPLKELRDPPPFLFAKGVVPEDWSTAVAVVGTREPSDYAIQMTRRVVDAFTVEPRTVVVSGLAVGTDSVAHARALECGLRTVAVLANGLDSVYPKGNAWLAERIVAEGGCLLSETPTGLGVSKYNLVARDRLQSGLARATFAMQTSISGGTMHTAQFTLEQRRTLVALKPPLDDASWSGNAFLLGQVRDEWLKERPNLQKFLRLPRPWAYALTESRLEEFVRAAIASGFVPKGTNGKAEADAPPPRAEADAPPPRPAAVPTHVSLFDAMNVSQHRLETLVEQLRALLPSLVTAVGYEDFSEIPRHLHRPELGLAQAAVAFRARAGNVKMVLSAPFNVRAGDPAAPIMGDGLSITLIDIADREINAGQWIPFASTPESLPDRVPQFSLSVDAFRDAVRLAENTLTERRREMHRKNAESAPSRAAYDAFAKIAGKTVARFEYGRGPRPARVAGDVHQWEYVRLHFTDGSALDISTGSNAAQVASEHRGLKASDFSADLMAFFHEDAQKAGKPH